jgi:type I restriction enzyme S subunit
MKRYDSYKDSGIEWIGEIPSHWELKPLKHLVFCNKDSLAENTNPEIEINYIEIGDVSSIDGIKGTTTYTFEKAPSRARRIVKKGDVIISTVRTYLKAITSITTNFDGYIASTGFAVLTPKLINSGFLGKLVLNEGFIGEIISLSKGVSYPSITSSDLTNITIPIPESTEQTAIANFLDQKTTQINDLIAKKERLIQLLEEERIAIINQAVTKGLDPSVPMKNSGVEWLGEIPAHWELKRMRYLCDITTGGRDTENREDDGLYPFYVRSQTVERISSYSFDGEAILTAGDGVGVCKVWHYVNEKFDFHQRVYMMCNFQQVLGKYLFYYLKENFGKEVMKLSAKSTVDSLRRPMFQNFLVCFGSIDEQKQIVLKIEKEENRIQTIIGKTQQEIELLKEYKTALISEVVTGKVDVRDMI